MPGFYVLEGIDGAGTTTVSKKVVDLLEKKDRPTLWTCEPSSGPIGVFARKVLKGELPLDPRSMLPLFLADRWWHIKHVVEQALQCGVNVICDRYAYSTWVYQQDTVASVVLRDLMDGMLAPTKVWVLDVPVSVAQKRKSPEKELFDDAKQQEYYRARYQNLVKYPESFRLGKEDISIVDAEHHNADEIANFIVEQILG